MMVKVGMGQMLVKSGDVVANLGAMERMIARAASEGCKVVVLPECADIGWTCPRARDLARPIPGENSTHIARAAREHDIHVVVGLTEKHGDLIYNAAILVSPDGDILLKHRKINVLSIAQGLYSTGNMLGVADVEIEGEKMKVGINICADNFRNSLAIGHVLARMGAKIIFSPSAWAVEAGWDNERTPYGGGWKESYQILSRLYDIAVIGVSNVGSIYGGPWDGKICIGNSIATGPGGEELAEASFGVDAEQLLVIDVEVIKHGVTGTGFASLLKMSGYDGP